MNLSAAVLVVALVLGAEPAPVGEENEAALNAQWRPIFDGVAAEYALVPDAESKPLDLVNRATYTWARSGPFGGTYGAVYVWTNQGNAEAVACFWRSPASDGRLSVAHELHSLCPIPLTSLREGPKSWKAAAGVQRRVVPDAPKPASSAIARLQQMRAITRDFTARSVSSRDERTELRLLPQPLYRFQSTNPEVLDGSLFAFVCSVGTDPEVFLQLEALQTPDGPQWHYALARFSHLNLFVSYREHEVWQAVRGGGDTLAHNADNTYWLFHSPWGANAVDAD